MNLVKHMEAVFVVALAAAGSASYFTDALPKAHASQAVIQDSSIATETRMAVVVVKAKRLSPVEQRVTVLAERRDGGRHI